MLNRRTFIQSGIAVGAASTLPAMAASARTPTSEFISKIGGTREEFDSEYGVGRDQDGWVVYGEDDPTTAYYYVLFNDQGIAETIECDFRHLESGGLPVEDQSGWSRFVPDDGTEIGPTATLSDYRATDPWYIATAWHSPELAEATGRSGNVVVVDGMNYFGIELSVQITHTMVSMETFEVNELVPNDEFMGAHTPLEEWEAYAGEPKSSFALTFQSDELPGTWIVTDRSASIEFSEPIGVAEANELTSSMVPVGEIGWTTFIPPSPMGEEGVRFHGIRYELGDTATAQWVVDGEESGIVTKIYTGFSSPTAQDTGA